MTHRRPTADAPIELPFQPTPLDFDAPPADPVEAFVLRRVGEFHRFAAPGCEVYQPSVADRRRTGALAQAKLFHRPGEGTFGVTAQRGTTLSLGRAPLDQVKDARLALAIRIGPEVDVLSGNLTQAQNTLR